MTKRCAKSCWMSVSTMNKEHLERSYERLYELASDMNCRGNAMLKEAEDLLSRAADIKNAADALVEKNGGLIETDE